MAGPGDLYDLAAEYLAACEVALAGSPGGSIPGGRVSPGPPAIDCVPFLAVYAGGPSEGDTQPLQPPLALGHRADYGIQVHLLNVTAVVARCLPSVSDGGVFPSPAEMSTVAVETTGDLWAIWNVVKQQYVAGTLFPPYGGRLRELFFDPAVPLPWAQDAVGWQIPLRVQLAGYDAP